MSSIATSVLEIEKKFQIPVRFEETLLSNGGKLTERREFQDVYYDLPDNSLTLKGLWLRKRNTKWELKHLNARCDPTISITDKYHETSDETKIMTELSKHVPMATSLDELVSKHCREFASFTTQRTSYQLPNDVRVDLDVASFGYSVGEIEIVIDDETGVSEAEQRLEGLAEKLGINWQKKFPGKVEEFLRLNDPVHLEKLMEKHLL
ncbi:predicted protein [Nematostella vectensis]|uniref:Thiamine-triphosphatase n=1 Tax=Nematostella vectensis TaxID=45351 RepID=A7SLG9_NEMVE|nr:thiamine-triphosphatase [Nematostella vectensis]EDO35436.1 predicted protein [Nematostella vectensis]|eukprot:XP_001627536.1 predicted protein [Nematostella vectensis]